MASPQELLLLLKARDEMSGVLNVAKGALIGLGAAAVGGLGLAVKAAADAESIAAQTKAVLVSTKGVAGVTEDAVNDLATALSRVSPFEDDAIVGAENMLLTFTSIGKDVFPEATETVLNMSQALGQDLKASAVQLGKALNDPIAGVTALRKVGVSLTEAQSAQIKKMMESGDLMGAQKIILKELATEFGGAARAAGGTFAGKLEIAKNAAGNVLEVIGGALLPILTDLASSAADAFAFLQDSGAIDAFVKGIQTAGTIIGEIFGVISGTAPGAGAALKGVVGPDVAGAIMGGLAIIRDAWQTTLTIVSNLVSAFQTGYWATFLSSLNGGTLDLRARLGDAAKAISGLVGTLLRELVAALPGIRDALLSWGRELVAWLVAAVPPMLAEAARLVVQLLAWIGDHSEDIGKMLGEWALKFGEFVVAAAILLATHLPEILLTIGRWVLTEAIPGVVRIFAGLGKGIVEGILSGLGELKTVLWNALVAAFESIEIQVGPFHISGRSGISVSFPTISLPSFSLPGFASGGVVPGPVGAPVLAVVHGGEEIRTPAQRGGGGEVYNLNFHAPVYGLADFRREVASAVKDVKARGGLRGSS